ncbi:metallophosphoesterase [bacterium]|nr:metallophosphoesterase [candidate division CSSED10-310 bacterium]
MQEIIHLSDLHVGSSKKVIFKLKKIINHIAERHPGVPVLITGDLTDSASEGQFKDTRELLDTLAITNPILAVPGNHDYAWKGIAAEFRHDAWKNWLEYLGSPMGWGRQLGHWLESDHYPVGVEGLGVFEHDETVFFGVDSGDPMDHELTARGYISDNLATALSSELKKFVGKTRIVFLHHHPFIHEWTMALEGDTRFKAAVSGNCELLLFGHKHDYGIWWNGENEIISAPLIVASHSTKNHISGKCYAYTLIRITRLNGAIESIDHSLEVVRIKKK